MTEHLRKKGQCSKDYEGTPGLMCIGIDITDRKKAEELRKAEDVVKQSCGQIRSLRPSILDDLGLVAAMEWHLKEFEKRSGIKTYFVYPKDEKHLTETVKTNLFRIFQESLTNVARQAQAAEVKVALSQQDSTLSLMIKDNDPGFDQKIIEEKKTPGILGMKERAAMIGGSYEIQSELGRGTTISVAIPLPNKIFQT